MNDFLLPPPLLSAPPGVNVFYRNTGPVSYAVMRADIVAARRALTQLEAPEVALFDADAYAFLVWLIACWLNGQTALLAADDLPATHEFLPYPWVGHCTDSVLPNWSVSETDEAAFPGPAPQFDCPGLVVFTSGSSGTPTRIFKAPSLLYQEAVMLHQTLGGTLPPGTRFVGTVPHQHYFGLAFRLMWPLWAGHPIIGALLHHPEGLEGLTTGPHMLISSPAMLKRLAQLETFSSPATFIAALSAGSPLQDNVAIACASWLKTQMIDFYGNTEIGSVMDRVVPGGSWRAHAGITLELDENGCLRILKPFACDGDWFQTQDVAAHGDNGWQLLGRADRVAKIEGRRVALDAIEAILAALPEIAEARTAPLYREREEILAAVVLSEVGRTQLQTLGKMRFDRWLRQRLSASLDLITIPRRWCYVSALPYNAMGKLTTADVTRLFERQALPPFVVTARAAHEVVLALALRDYMQAFDGHFPEMPILPGVIQTDWALRLAQRYFPIEGRFSALRQLRFQRILRPDDEVSLTLRFFPEKKEVRFAYASALGVHSQGRASFAHPTDAPNTTP
jgi:hypothetical protein